MPVNSAMKSATVAAAAAARSARPRRTYTTQTNAYATTTSPAASMVPDHDTGATRAHAYTTTAAAITPAACSSAAATASEAALTASVNTTRAPNSGHGGIDDCGSPEMKNRKACPSSPRYAPRRKPIPRNTAGVSACSESDRRAVCACDHACPASITMVRSTSTSNDGNSPTAAAALFHQTASTNHDSDPPTSDSHGNAPAALSMKMPASRSASSSARPQSATPDCDRVAR